MAYTGDKKRAYQRAWLRSRRDKAIEYLGSVCSVCGNTDDLEFDHKNRALKSANISHLLSRKWSVLRIELDKCQLLCSACHLVKTVSEQSTGLSHGLSAYAGGCRCETCKLAKQAQNKKRFI